MKKILFPIFGLILISGIFAACLKDKCTTTKTFIRLDPVYLSVDEIRKSVAIEPARELKNPGKIYTFQNYLLINELREGIHIFDNSNPSNPAPLGFMNISGNVDMAVRGNFLYADQYTDLLTFDISDILQPKMTCRAENVFQLYGYDPYKGYLVEYTPTTVTETLTCDDERFNNGWWQGGGGIWVLEDSFADASGGPKNSSGGGALAAATGVSGSYARISFYNNFMYAVDNSQLYPFDLASPDCPKKNTAVPLGWNIETIFPWKNYLFVGSQSGVFILDATNPNAPVYVNAFWHATGCDPVVCDDKYAYITIHDGTNCNGNNFNQLEIVGIEHLPQTAHLKTYQMVKPFGLGLRDNLLFVCDDGLKIYDRTDINNLKLLSHKKDIKAWDTIALSDGITLVIGEGGFYQFDTTDPSNPKELSKILVKN